MADGPAPATVSPSRPLGCETPRHPACRRDSTETIGEASGLKALARLVLARDRRRDIECDEVPGANSGISTARHHCLDVAAAKERDTETPIAKTTPVVKAAAEGRLSGNLHRATIVEHVVAIPRSGLPEIPDIPVLLRDGRRLWRFRSTEDCSPHQAAALIGEAHRCGAVVIADGRELIVAERWLSRLPVEALCELRRYASGVIQVLHQQSRTHPDATTPEECPQRKWGYL